MSAYPGFQSPIARAIFNFAHWVERIDRRIRGNRGPLAPMSLPAPVRVSRRFPKINDRDGPMGFAPTVTEADGYGEAVAAAVAGASAKAAPKPEARRGRRLG